MAVVYRLGGFEGGGGSLYIVFFVWLQRLSGAGGREEAGVFG